MNNEKWNRRYAGKDLVWPEEPASLLVELTGGMPPGKALDLAAGEGRNSIWLARRGWEVDAVDFSDVGVEKGRRLTGKPGLPVYWEVADLTTFRPVAAGYDLVILFYLHMPWKEIFRVFEKAAGAVKTGGYLLIAGHDLSNIKDGVGGPRDPAVLYTVEMILPLLPDMEILRAEKVLRPVDHEGVSAAAATADSASGDAKSPVDCVVLARRD